MKDFFEHIGDYIEGKLNEEDRKLFEAEMARNQELTTAVKNHDVVVDALDLMMEEDIRGVMEGINDEQGGADVHGAMRVRFPKGLRSYLIFMVITLLAFAASYIFKQSQQPKEQILYAAYFKPYMQEGTRGDVNDIESLKDCDKGHYHLTQGDVIKAINNLERSVQINEDCAKKEWYLALAYLKSSKIEECTELLTVIIAQTETPYKKQAQELLTKLD